MGGKVKDLIAWMMRVRSGIRRETRASNISSGVIESRTTRRGDDPRIRENDTRSNNKRNGMLRSQGDVHAMAITFCLSLHRLFDPVR